MSRLPREGCYTQKASTNAPSSIDSEARRRPPSVHPVIAAATLARALRSISAVGAAAAATAGAGPVLAARRGSMDLPDITAGGDGGHRSPDRLLVDFRHHDRSSGCWFVEEANAPDEVSLEPMVARRRLWHECCSDVHAMGGDPYRGGNTSAPDQSAASRYGRYRGTAVQRPCAGPFPLWRVVVGVGAAT
eukprot:ctg_1872.g700